MLNIVLFGPPGSGKGTQAENIINTYQLIHLSTGDMLRAEIAQNTVLGNEAKTKMDRGELVPDSIVIGMIENKLRQDPTAKGFVFDGFPRTVAQAQALDDLLDKISAPIKTVLSLKVSEIELTRRILARGKTSGRADDQDEATVQNRVQEYRHKTEPLATYYSRQAKLREIPGELSVGEVFKTIAVNINDICLSYLPNIEAQRVFIVPVVQLPDLVVLLFKKVFNFDNADEKQLADKLQKYIDRLRTNIWASVEIPYVDKVYRDTYYHFFSTKQKDIPRDCIKVSFFDAEVNYAEFRDENQKAEIQKKYLGFLVVRPTLPNTIGRNVITPLALRERGFKICATSIDSTANSIKLDVKGFPHLSQDNEAIRCAEACLINIMEYFGNRYPEYHPILPSTVHHLLRKFSTERQLPSLGLDANSISYVLRKLGFGAKIYFKKSFPEQGSVPREIFFKRMLYTYIESGIPVIAALSNRDSSSNNNPVNHAVCVIGKKEKPLTTPVIFKNFGNNIEIADYFDNFYDKIIVNDDNFPPYLEIDFDNPTQVHSTHNPTWANCKIDTLIVPLYRKIYLDAFNVHQYTSAIIANDKLFIDRTSNRFITKTFLASSRSFKEYAAYSSMNDRLKEYITSSNMPKFIWVTEISDEANIVSDLINGLIIYDATESKGEFSRPIILAWHKNRLIKRLSTFGVLKQISLICPSFKSYKSNHLSYE